MTTLRRYVSLGLSLCAAVVLFVCLVPGIAAQDKTVHLSFAFPEGKVFNYKASKLEEMTSSGMEVTFSHSMMVELSLSSTMEDGISKIALSFGEEDASLFRDGELEDYEPQVKLGGTTVYAFVNAKGEVTKTEASSYISGLSSEDELREIIEDWFVRLPDADIVVGTQWRTEIVKMGMSQEGEEPEVKGYTDFKLKKIEEKNGLMIAEIEGKTQIDINKAMYSGTLIAKGKGEIKTKIAVEGGYIIECKRKMDMKGKTMGKDPITGKESESETVLTQYFECKMEK
jgi:hypothetical protein